MDKAQVRAIETQENIRALVVGAGIMSAAEAAQYIRVRVGKLGEGSFKHAVIPAACKHEDFVPLEIGISNAVSESTRDAIGLLLSYTSGPTN
jgi:hypothetical protein